MSVIGDLGAAIAFDRLRVGQSLREVLDRLSQVDLRSALPTQTSAGVPHQELAAIVATLDGIRKGWTTRVQEKLGSRKVDVLRELLSQPLPDLLGILGKQHDENAHSDVIRWLLDPACARSVASAALQRLVGHLDEPDRWRAAIHGAVDNGCLSVRREFTIGREWTGEDSLERIDLVISGPGFLLAIENKVWSSEHDDQTDGYWRWLERQTSMIHAGIFLTPSGITAACPSFKPLSYMELLSCLLERKAAAPMTKGETALLGGYVKTLANHILRAELRAIRDSEAGSEQPQ